MLNLSPINTIAGLLRHLPDGLIPNDRSTLHEAVFNLKERYPTRLIALRFFPGETYPKSNQLDDILKALAAEGVLCPQESSWTIDKAKAKAAWERVPEWQEHDSAIKSMARTFASMI